MNVIKANVSKYKNKKVYDSEIIRFTGVNTYCTLYNLSPNLYRNFIECYHKDNFIDEGMIPYVNPTIIEYNLMETGLTDLEIKEQLISYMIDKDETINETIKKLKNSSPSPGIYFETDFNDLIVMLIVFFIIVSIIVFSLYQIGKHYLLIPII